MPGAPALVLFQGGGSLTRERKEFGARAEEFAADYLRKNGYRILERNFRISLGEIDIVAEKDGQIVFAEVKAGSGDDDFPPHVHLDGRKRAKLLNLARAYLSRFPTPRAARIDLIAVTEDGDSLRVDHFDDVVEDVGP